MKNTKEYNKSLNQKQRIETISKAIGTDINPNWDPYCLKCSSLRKMKRTDYGWKCLNCGNEIGWNLEKITN